MEGTADRIAKFRNRIAEAAERCGRRQDEITLVAVTKKQLLSAVTEALTAGLGDVGENYVQEAAGKQAALSPTELGSARWHLIGHLQSNKVKAAVKTFDLIQSVDSVRLARQVGREAKNENNIQEILLQVHLGDEEAKSGFPPTQVLEATGEIGGMSGVRLLGLMGIAPTEGDPRPHFQQLRLLYEALPAQNRRILSMGMSGDFETAIEEGTTMIRIGTALFGQRATGNAR